MKKKLITVTLALTGLVIIGASILLFLGFFKPQQAGILVESNPISTVYINGQEVGKTPYEIETSPGEISLRINPDQVEGQVLDDYETKVTLTSGIKTIIKRDFRESEENSSGVVVSFEKLSGDEAYVTVVSVPDNSQVVIDGKIYGYTPLRVKIPAGDHNLVVTADNYIEKQLPIRVFKGFKLTASVKLAKSEEQDEVKQEVEPIELEPKERIRINKNEVGFLRVRSGANIGFPVVAEVKPGEEYDVLDTGEGVSWYKIRVGDIEGWVNGEFVTKI